MEGTKTMMQKIKPLIWIFFAIYFFVWGLAGCNSEARANEWGKDQGTNDITINQGLSEHQGFNSKDFKTNGWGRLEFIAISSKNDWNYNLDNTFTRDGNISQRFEFRPGDCGKDKTYSDCVRGDWKGAYGRIEQNLGDSNRKNNCLHDCGEVFYAWSIFIDNNVKLLDDQLLQMGQFKFENKTWGKILKKSKGKCKKDDFAGINLMFKWDPYGGMDVYREICDAKKGYSEVNEEILKPGNIKGEWKDFLVHTNWSAKEDGFLYIYVNGKLVYEEHGNIIGTKIKRNGKESGTIFRYGIYTNSNPKEFNPIIVHFDALARSNKCNKKFNKHLEGLGYSCSQFTAH